RGGLSPEILDLFRDVLDRPGEPRAARGLGLGGDDDVCPFPGAGDRTCPTDAPRCPGDEDHPVLERPERLSPQLAPPRADGLLTRPWRPCDPGEGGRLLHLKLAFGARPLQLSLYRNPTAGVKGGA